MKNAAHTKLIMEKTIALFNLDLRKTNVLTEAANGHFFVTPIIAALAGADVTAVTKDSPYGTKEEVQKFVRSQAEQFNVAGKINFVYDSQSNNNPLTVGLINKADIITNSGFLRPLDTRFLENVHRNAVIAGMYEDWELRKEDIDFEECRSRKISVVAVNEESETLNIFRYVGYLTMKMMFDCGLEVYRNKILIVSSDKFGTTIADVLSYNGAETKTISPGNNLSTVDNEPFDVVIIADCTLPKSAFAGLTSTVIKKIAPLLIHLAGEVDADELQKNGILCFPQKPGRARNMALTLSYLGIKPVIELQTAGLAAASIILKEKITGNSYEQIQHKYRNHPFCRLI